MKTKLILAGQALALLAATGCSSVKVWPFDDEKIERSRVPANAAEFRCADGKRFHVRQLDGGNAAWLILPDREVRLDKAAGSTARYSNGITTLDIEAATLTDRTLTLAGCKTPTAVAK